MRATYANAIPMAKFMTWMKGRKRAMKKMQKMRSGRTMPGLSMLTDDEDVCMKALVQSMTLDVVTDVYGISRRYRVAMFASSSFATNAGDEKCQYGIDNAWSLGQRLSSDEHNLTSKWESRTYEVPYRDCLYSEKNKSYEHQDCCSDSRRTSRTNRVTGTPI